MTDARLTSQDWLLAGIDALCDYGPQALKAEAIARQLDTTKGSFYWHFKGIETYRIQMVDLWAKQAVTAFSGHLKSEESLPLRLRLLAVPLDAATPIGAMRTEIAMRGWAQSDHTVANVLANIDAQRTETIAGILRQMDVTDPSFASLIYGAWVGLHMQNQANVSSPMETLIDLILALR
ncbi:MAG: TetR/AcrR family transcriptional regulator [Paracoccaceae bacterium]